MTSTMRGRRPRWRGSRRPSRRRCGTGCRSPGSLAPRRQRAGRGQEPDQGGPQRQEGGAGGEAVACDRAAWAKGAREPSPAQGFDRQAGPRTMGLTHGVGAARRARPPAGRPAERARTAAAPGRAMPAHAAPAARAPALLPSGMSAAVRMPRPDGPRPRAGRAVRRGRPVLAPKATRSASARAAVGRSDAQRAQQARQLVGAAPGGRRGGPEQEEGVRQGHRRLGPQGAGEEEPERAEGGGPEGDGRDDGERVPAWSGVPIRRCRRRGRRAAPPGRPRRRGSCRSSRPGAGRA